MKYILNILFYCVIVTTGMVVQAQTVLNNTIGHESAVLDMSVNSQGKTFLPPRVSLGPLTDNVNPINNPAEGLIVYNIGSSQLPGFYIFQDGIWSLLASRENSVSNALLQKTTASNISLTNTFNTVPNFTQFFNNTSGSIVFSNNAITLQPGMYVVSVELNVSTSETSTNGIGGTLARTHSHFYAARLWNGTTSLGGVVNSNASSNTSATLKKHVVSFSFAFTLSNTETVSFQLARRPGGTYNGDITLNNAFIHIEKSIL